MSWIERNISNTINKSADEYPALVLTGARQTGKTSLLSHLYPQASYVSLDEPSEAAEADQDGGAFFRRRPEPIIIDEVQYAPNLFRFLKIAIDKQRKSKGRFLLTGSQRFQMMERVGESLAGRVAVLELLTLSTAELERASGKIAEGDQLSEWILMGGYPELHAESKDRERFFRNYLATYIERDVRTLINVKSARDFDRFIRLAAMRTGQLLSYTSMAADLGVSPPTVREWISVLQASGLIEVIEPWHGNAAKRLIKTPKLYFLDSGLCCHLLNMRSITDLHSSPLLGALFETHVLSQMKKTLAGAGRALPIYFFRDHAGHELDFVVPEAGRFHVFECKWSDHPQLDLKNLAAFRQLVGADSIRRCALVGRQRGRRIVARDGTEIVDSVDFSEL